MEQIEKSNNFNTLVNTTAILEAIIMVIVMPGLLVAGGGESLVFFFLALIAVSFITGVAYTIIALNNWYNDRVEYGLLLRQLVLSALIAAVPLLFGLWLSRGLGC